MDTSKKEGKWVNAKKTDKSQILSPYACKHENEITNIETSLNKLDKKIDILIDINTKLSVQEERLTNVEKRQEEITNRLWYVCGGTIIALIGAFMKFLL